MNSTLKVKAHAIRAGLTAHPQIKNIIAVASAKGGVGKSTTAVNLALALAKQGARVGLLDADIYGPNQPHMLGSKTLPETLENKQITPVICHGIQTMSIGYLIDPATPMIWRGPMVSSALQQLLNGTEWDNLDYLLVDLPPGTGDIQLTLAQKIPVSGAVIVTTPQDVALLDTLKGYQMFKKVDVPVLGIIENMSIHICKQCGHTEALFGEGGGEHLAKVCHIPLLGQLPLALEIRQAADEGCPIVVKEPESKLAAIYHEIARRMSFELSQQPINRGAKFPKIVVE